MSGYHHCRNNLDDSGYFVLKYRSYETLFNSSSIGIDMTFTSVSKPLKYMAHCGVVSLFQGTLENQVRLLQNAKDNR